MKGTSKPSVGDAGPHLIEKSLLHYFHESEQLEMNPDVR
jgi:hypothetical protein